MQIRDAATPEVANPLIAADDVVTAPEPEVPPPFDVPSMPPEQSGANRKNLALSGSSGQAVLQLNAVTADGRGKIAPNQQRLSQMRRWRLQVLTLLRWRQIRAERFCCKAW
jgi:hypothetical protein